MMRWLKKTTLSSLSCPSRHFIYSVSDWILSFITSLCAAANTIHQNPKQQKRQTMTHGVAIITILLSSTFLTNTSAAFQASHLSSLPSRVERIMMADENNSASCSQELLPILSHALPSIISYTLPSDKVVQANAEGARILARHHSSTLSEKYVNNDTAAAAGGEDSKGDDYTEEDDGDSRLLVTAHDESEIEETELFLKRVTASSYTHKSWTDMRRTLVYLRTEVRFYNEIVPLLLAASSDNGNDHGASAAPLQKYLPNVYHAAYDLDGLVSEDCPTTNAKQPSPFPEDGGEEGEARKHQLLTDKGGHMLLESLSPSHGYFQSSPISLQQSLSCLKAVAELHASAWGNQKLLQTINDRLSSAGGSYQLQFRNPKEMQNMVASWEYFRGQFVGLGGTSILEKESVVRLGQRVYDMAEYVSQELTPLVDDEYATLVHGDYKAMVSIESYMLGLI